MNYKKNETLKWRIRKLAFGLAVSQSGITHLYL